jgi:NADH:ubiquinone oxidoreductase subunit D
MHTNCLLTLSADTGISIGIGNVLTCDTSFASHTQRFHLPIPAGATAVMITDIRGDGECWIVSDGPLRPKLFPVDTTSVQRLGACPG